MARGVPDQRMIVLQGLRGWLGDGEGAPRALPAFTRR